MYTYKTFKVHERKGIATALQLVSLLVQTSESVLHWKAVVKDAATRGQCWGDTASKVKVTHELREHYYA